MRTRRSARAGNRRHGCRTVRTECADLLAAGQNPGIRKMPTGTLAHETDWTGWRRATRAFVLAGVAPPELNWTVGGTNDAVPNADGSFTLSRTLVALAAQAFQVRELERFALLYTLIWRAHRRRTDTQRRRMIPTSALPNDGHFLCEPRHTPDAHAYPLPPDHIV